MDLVKAGCSNIVRHIANAKKFGVPVVVAINRFATDTDKELEVRRMTLPLPWSDWPCGSPPKKSSAPDLALTLPDAGGARGVRGCGRL